MNSESLRRSARAMHRDSGSAKREKAVTTATIHYLRGRAPELRMATHLEDAQRPFQRALPARLADSPSLAASNLASCRTGIRPRFLLTSHQKRFRAFVGPGLRGISFIVLM